MRSIAVALCFLVAASLGAVGVGHADDLKAAMEASNAEWLAAYNTQNGTAFSGFYTKDAVLMVPGQKPILGAEAIGKHWADEVKDGSLNNHTWKILRVRRSGKTAYQVARFTVDLVEKSDNVTHFAGNTVRILELQPDGKWLTTVHIYNSDEH